MEKNILCILSSPRQNSNSGLLAEAVLEGAAEHGGRACGAEHQSLPRLFRLYPFR